MPDCVFCKIARGEIPCYKVYEDKDFLGFLDINPLTRGHTLVVPKKHYRWVEDVPNFGNYFEVVKKIGLAAKKVLGPGWVCYLTLGLDVPHAHIHIIPRYPNDLHGTLINLEKKERIPEEEMKEIAAKLKKTIQQ